MLIKLIKYLYWVIVIAFFFQPGESMGQQQAGKEPVTIKVIVYPYLSYAPFFIAKEEGYFADQGLNVEFVKVKQAAATQALASGEVDVGADLVNAGTLNAIGRGAKVRYVAEKGRFAVGGCDYIGVIARKTLVESGQLKDASQLKGRRLAIRPNSFEDYFLEKVLPRGGLTRQDVELLKIPTPAELGAMKKGDIDLTMTGEPWVTRFLRSGHGVIWMSPKDVIPDFQFAIIRFGPNLIEKNPDAGKRFMVAWLTAVRQYNQGKTARNLEILSKYTKIDKALLNQACWAELQEDGRINAQSVLDFQDWAVGKGLLDKTIPEQEFYDPSFINYANQVLDSKQ